MLCRSNPAEYVRLMGGLFSPTGEVKLRSGQLLRRVPDSIPPDGRGDRTASERVFQSALLEYANEGLVYSNRSDRSAVSLFGLKLPLGHSGLGGNQMRRGLKALFGGDFKLRKDASAALTAAKSSGQTLVLMKWASPKGGDLHAVVVTRVEGDRVFLRNPWGVHGDPPGTVYANSPRRMEDPSIDEESMSVRDFQRAMKFALL